MVRQKVGQHSSLWSIPIDDLAQSFSYFLCFWSIVSILHAWKMSFTELTCFVSMKRFEIIDWQ
ncbi:hypothetical protein T4B_10933 [Trichinella pseudospiralis]|uniref:Uncharacterized protein n=1 Tax=Trichinella pseudospiralis TaxID=6337 RepID=A0A0V1H2F3_TRIPS|nr:hypothetical protein T4B_10933 [Trichinella pseudospiralis]